MRKQVIKMTFYGVYRVIYDDSKKYNKYIITLNNTKVIDYADLRSCLKWLEMQVPNN